MRVPPIVFLIGTKDPEQGGTSDGIDYQTQPDTGFIPPCHALPVVQGGDKTLEMQGV
jgi:hypothetical protein